MVNEIEIITASFQGNGLFNEGKRCVYIINFNRENDKYYYVGKTGTTNQTGVNPPFKRLAAHLMAQGKTKSCIFNKDKNGSGEKKPLLEREYYRNMKFTAIYLEDNAAASFAEQLLCYVLNEVVHGKIINKECSREPGKLEKSKDEVILKVVELLKAAELEGAIPLVFNFKTKKQ